MSISPEQRYALKLKSAYYLYEKDYTQMQVSEMLGISRVTLGKLIAEAKDEGIIRIEIVDVKSASHYLEMEATLKERFDLLDVRIVDCPADDQKEINRKLGQAGAKYFQQFLRSGMKIGVAWGHTLEVLVESLSENKRITDIEVVTLLGGAGVSNSEIQPNILAQRFLDKYSGKGYVINAPYLCRSEELRDALKAEPHIQSVIERAAQTDICLVGVGGMPAIGGNGVTEKPLIDNLLRRGAVGDVCANYFVADGSLCQSDISARILSVDIAILRNIRRVIAVAGGPNKGSSVLGALLGRYCNTLVTDQHTAQYLLDHS